MDYKKLGLKVGLEVHQQISNKKLFCNCSATMKEGKLVGIFERKLRPVAGETGEIDIAAAYETTRDKRFIYHIYEDEVCSIECDEQPPIDVNQDALKTALGVAKSLKMEIPNELHVMRKHVNDGSTCSSFQRTLVCGMESPDSFIQTSEGPVKITTLCLEEDACKRIKITDKKVWYSLSRQGIPLLELRTDPDIHTPEQAKETAAKIGSILRSFPSTRRGIGTIRQDVNLSIKGGARVEIKGFQDLRTMPKIIENEIKRQLGIIKSGKRVKNEVRKAHPDGTTSFMRPLPGAARLYPDTDEKPIAITKEILSKIKIPELISDKISGLQKKHKISNEMANQLVKSGKDELFKIITKIGFKPKFVFRALTSMLKDLERENISTEKITNNLFLEIFKTAPKNISKEALYEALKTAAKTGKVEKIESDFSDSDLRKIIKKVIDKNKDALKKHNPIGILMGQVMKEIRGKCDGKKVAQFLREEIGN